MASPFSRPFAFFADHPRKAIFLARQTRGIHDVSSVRLLKTDWFLREARILCPGLSAALMMFLVSSVKTPGADADWVAHIEPLLKERCAECHNPTKPKSGLDLSSLQTILRGGERGPAVIPGRPDESNLYKFLS